MRKSTLELKHTFSEFYGLLLIVILFTSCTHSLVRDFSRRHSCPRRDTRTSSTSNGYTKVSGCGKTEYYDCRSGKCSLSTAAFQEDVALVKDPSSPVKRSSASVDGKDGSSRLGVQIGLGNQGALLRLMASLDKDPRHVGIEVSSARSYRSGGDVECELQIMTGSGLLDLPSTQHEVRGSKRYMRLKIPRRIFYAIAASDYIVVRACDQRWPLERSQLNSVRRFALALEEEIAIRKREGKLSATALGAPADGWLPWKPPSNKPAPAKTKPIKPDVLFKQLQPSVYTVDVKAISGSSQGSAVAVTSRRLLTNCHVLEGATSLILRTGEFELKAKFVASDPNSDRCVLELVDGEVKPVDGVRPFDDLKVGEQVFALGAPMGLEHTFSEGIVSAKRFSGQAAFIQTTAPISPGSSGGGLFDSAGNLVGITTLTAPGRERLNQALNFAIAADRFWIPGSIDPRDTNEKKKEKKVAKQFDPDINLQVGTIRLRLAGDVSKSKTHLLLMLQRDLDQERWNRCKLKLSSRVRDDAYKTHYRIRDNDKEQTESVELKLPLTQLKAWSAKKDARIYLCGREYVRLDSDNAKKVREAIARFEQLIKGAQSSDDKP